MGGCKFSCGPAIGLKPKQQLLRKQPRGFGAG